MDKQNPGGGGGGVGGNFAVDIILAGDLLPKTLYYSATSNSAVPCHWSADLPPQLGTSTTVSVWTTRIRVGGQQEIRVQPPAYLSRLSATQQLAVMSQYGFRLREAVIRTMKGAMPITTADADQLCYAYAVPLRQWSSLPRVAVLLGSDNGGVMSVDATRTVWYQEPFGFCLGIGRTLELIPPSI